MSLLVVDLGNSRVKWALHDDGPRGPSRSAAYGDWSADDWRRALFAAPGIERVIVASVVTGRAADLLRVAARGATGRDPEFAVTSRETAGVRNAYPEPALLGVDRWLAVIAAHHDPGGACCVVDVGTATTIDAVRGDGQHLGGFIVPGPRLMVGSLWHGTSELATRSAASGPGVTAHFADNTRDAIERGCRLALASLVDRCVADLEVLLGTAPRLLLSGGAAGEVRALLKSPCTVEPDLVLRGLLVASAGPAGGTAGIVPHSK